MNKSKMDFLVLVISCMSIFVLFLFSGCGQNKIECIKCGVSDADGVTAQYISLPMCGGCLTSGWGCNTCLYPQKCAVSCASGEEVKYISDSPQDSQQSDNTGVVINCDNVYYGNSCIMCGGNERNDYSGIVLLNGLSGCYCGSTKCNDEYFMAPNNGCICVKKTDGVFADFESNLENYVDTENYIENNS